MPNPNSDYDKELKEYLPHNFLVHSIEGGLYLAGMTFVARDIVLPPIIQSLGGPDWMIAMAPVMVMIGMCLPSIFIVHKIETMYWKKPLLIVTGIFQRLPVLFAGLGLLFFADDYPRLVLILVAFAPLFSGLFFGLSYPAWMELIAKTIPASRRASVFALRLIIASSVGLCAGGIIAAVLSKYPGPTGYGILHLIAFAFLLISYSVFLLVKETNLPPHSTETSTFFESISEARELIGKDSTFLKYLLNLFFSNSVFIAIPFLPIYTMQVLDKPKSFLGFLVMAKVMGVIAGNITAGYLGDKYGGRIGLFVSRISYMLILTALLFFSSEWFFLFAFCVFGFSLGCGIVSRSVLSIEISPPERRLKYIAIINTVTLPGMLGAAMIGASLWSAFHNLILITVITVILGLVSLCFLWRIKEPRQS